MDSEKLINTHLNGAALKFVELVDHGKLEEAFAFAEKEIANGYEEMTFYKCWAQTWILIADPLNPPSDTELISIRDGAISTLSVLKSKVDKVIAFWIIISLEGLLRDKEQYSLLSNDLERLQFSVMNISLIKDVDANESFFKAFTTRLNKYGKELANREAYWQNITTKSS